MSYTVNECAKAFPCWTSPLLHRGVTCCNTENNQINQMIMFHHTRV